MNLGRIIATLFIFLFALCVVGLLLFVTSSIQALVTPPVRTQSPLVIPLKPASTFVIAGTIDENGIAADRQEYQPFVDYLTKHLRSVGITSVQYIPMEDPTDIAVAMREQQVDAVIDSVFPVYVVDELSGAVPILDRWKGGEESYNSVVFVRASSTIQNLDDLKGKVIAFDSPNSTAGYFLPKAELIQLGYALTEKSSSTDSVPPNEIGYVFMHGNVYQSVQDGVTVAGAESQGEVEGYFGSTISQYRYLFTTHAVPRFLVAVRGDLDPAVTNVFTNVLLGMSSTTDGQQTLFSFADTSRFTSLTGSSTAYGVVGTLTNLVEDEIIRQ